MKNNISILLILSIIFIIASVIFIQNRIIFGASIATEDGKYPVSKSITLLAKQNPDELYNRMLPYSLLGGLVAGILFFCIGLLIIRLTRTSEKKPAGENTQAGAGEEKYQHAKKNII